MEKPTCVCGQEMNFGMDSKSRIIFECPGCGRLLVRHKDSP